MTKVIFENKRSFPFGLVMINAGKDKFDLKRGEVKEYSSTETELAVMVRDISGTLKSTLTIDLSDQKDTHVLIKQHVSTWMYIVMLCIVLILFILSWKEIILNVFLTSFICFATAFNWYTMVYMNKRYFKIKCKKL
jgi:Flp pilus assembly protein TadB